MVMGRYSLIIFCVLWGEMFFFSPGTKTLRKSNVTFQYVPGSPLRHPLVGLTISFCEVTE